MKLSQMVFVFQSGHDFVTEIFLQQTDGQGKNHMSPNPTRGDIITDLSKAVLLLWLVIVCPLSVGFLLFVQFLGQSCVHLQGKS